MDKETPHALIVAGPNGAGKSTLAPVLMERYGIDVFLNADVIAAELAPEDVASAAVQAGRIMHERLAEVRTAHESFALETTLSGGSLRRSIDRLRVAGYWITLAFLWLPSPDLAVQRVRVRHLRGGHFVPEHDVRRRWARGIHNIVHVYRELVPSWQVYAAGYPHTSGPPRLIAAGAWGNVRTVPDPASWATIQAQAAQPLEGGSDD